MEGKLYLSLDSKALDKSYGKAKKDYIDEYGEDGEPNDLLYQNLDLSNVNLEVTDNDLIISGDTDLGFLSISIKMDTDTTVHIIEHMVKKMNRIKTAMESLF